MNSPDAPKKMVYKKVNEEGEEEPTKVAYTYSVRVVQSERLWMHRFDHYVKAGHGNVHNIQFFTSALIAAIFFGIVKCGIESIIKGDIDKARLNNDKLKKARDTRRELASDVIN